MIPRFYQQELAERLASFPVVVILGPRQCGKTTFIRSALPEWKYQDLERPAHCIPLSEDPEGRLRGLGDHVIFDEAQQVPVLFDVVRVVVDEVPDRKGRFVFLGSASPLLVRSISESLAGRCAFIDMSGFIWKEVASKVSLNDLWLRGGLPPALLQENDRVRAAWWEGYERTFVERDLNALGIDISVQMMRRLMLMSAHVNGKQWNASDIANSLGVSYPTVNRYIDILEQAFLIRRLRPWHANIGKRLVKRPKLHFRDSGLLHFLSGIFTAADLDSHPQRGMSWESFLIEQIIMSVGRPFTQGGAWYWRTAGGAEVDLLLSIDGSMYPFEIKLHSVPSSSMVRGLKECMKDLSLPKGFVVYPGNDRYELGNGVEVVPVKELLKQPETLLRKR